MFLIQGTSVGVWLGTATVERRTQVTRKRHPAISITEKFLTKGWTVQESGCWIWNGGFDTHNYGVVEVGARRTKIRKLAHRVSFEHFNGPLVAGMDICHKCDNTQCIAPTHLFQGTRQENVDDAWSKGRLFRPCEETGIILGHAEREEIFARFVPYKTTAKQLAAEFGVSVAHIYTVIKQRKAGDAK